MDILLQLVFSGIALGMIYAVIAFGYQLTFATSGTLNFGQGEALDHFPRGKPMENVHGLLGHVGQDGVGAAERHDGRSGEEESLVHEHTLW